jgi:hypothetical protein
MHTRILLALSIALSTQAHADVRPKAWCGFYARHNLVTHDPGIAYNLASNWRHYGRPSPVPCLNCMVVFNHHVGKIVGPCHGYNCVITSGNDGGAVRTRERSVAGAEFRIIP